MIYILKSLDTKNVTKHLNGLAHLKWFLMQSVVIFLNNFVSLKHCYARNKINVPTIETTLELSSTISKNKGRY